MDIKEDFTQLRLRFTDPVQQDYEVIRPVVLFAQSANSRSQETKVARTTVREKAKQFVIEGMLGLVGRVDSAKPTRTDALGEFISFYGQAAQVLCHESPVAWHACAPVQKVKR